MPVIRETRAIAREAVRRRAKHPIKAGHAGISENSVAIPSAVLAMCVEETSRQREQRKAEIIVSLKGELAALEKAKKPGAAAQQIDLIRYTLAGIGENWPSPLPCLAYEMAETASATKLAVIGYNFERALTFLELLAKGKDSAAVQSVARYALRLSKLLSDLGSKCPKLIKPVAQESIVWPVLKSSIVTLDDTKHRLDRTHKVLLRKLRVGELHPIKGQRWNARDKLSELTFELFDEVRAYTLGGAVFILPRSDWHTEALRLPKFKRNRSVVEKWHRVILLLLKERYPTDKKLIKAFGRLVKAESKQGTGTKASQLRYKIGQRLLSMAGIWQRERQPMESRKASKEKRSQAPRKLAVTPEWIQQHRNDF